MIAASNLYNKWEGKRVAFRLGDDGTMDTVIVCDDCGAEIRFTYDAPDADDDDTRTDDQRYDEWIAECIAECEEDHECAEE